MITGLLAVAVLLAGELDAPLAQWQPVRMPYEKAKLSARERKLVDKLVLASQYMEAIYWRQFDPDGLKLYQTTQNKQLKRFLLINGGRYDLVAENKPFAGAPPMPPGRNLYPAGLTREMIEAYVKAHPEQKDAIYSPYTVIKGTPEKLETIPYHVAYKEWLDPAAKALREAAALSDEPPFAAFLKARADALLSDDYYPSDLLWVDLPNPKFDIIFAPYETYLDDVLGVKGSFSAAVMIRNEEESAKLALYQKYVPEIQEALPLSAEDKPSKRGQPTPMEVMDTPYRAGDLRHGYQAVADNLPNDPRIHQAKGTKKLFFRNYMDARVNTVVLPLARQVMPAAQAAKASGEGYLAAVVLHEICHGLGPSYARKDGSKADIREAIGPIYAALEEAKADVTGMFGLAWLMDHGALSKDRAEEYYASYVAGIFRSVRYGIAEAHGRAEMMEFNYLSEQGAIRREGNRYAVDYAKIPAALASLAKELLEIEATGDRSRAERWFERYDKMPDHLAAALKAVKGVPVDIDPIGDFPLFPPKR